jgi:hypothetical protein
VIILIVLKMFSVEQVVVLLCFCKGEFKTQLILAVLMDIVMIFHSFFRQITSEVLRLGCDWFIVHAFQYVMHDHHTRPTPMATWSKVEVCSCLLFGIVGLNTARQYGCLSLVRVECCQVGVSAVG